MPGKRAQAAKQRVESQARGTYRNSRDLVGSFTFDKVLPSSISGFIQELFALVPKALGRGSAKQQVWASTTLVMLAIISTPFTLGYSLIVAAPFVVTLFIGLYRNIPAVNSGFVSLRGNKLRDRDVPLWKRD